MNSGKELSFLMENEDQVYMVFSKVIYTWWFVLETVHDNSASSSSSLSSE